MADKQAGQSRRPERKKLPEASSRNTRRSPRERALPPEPPRGRSARWRMGYGDGGIGGDNNVAARRRGTGLRSPVGHASGGGSPTQAPKPTLFLTRLFEMVNDPKTDQAIRWNQAVGAPGAPGVSAFTIVDNMLLEKRWLPKFYKHSNFTSFVRQLNQYQFRKLESKRWTFGHESFVKQRPDLLVHVNRKRKETIAKPKEPSQAEGTRVDQTSRVVQARQARLETYVKALAEALQRAIDQQTETQRQLNELSRRIDAGYEPSRKKQRVAVAAEVDEVATGLLPPWPPTSLPASGPAFPVTQARPANDSGASADIVEFADVDIPADLDQILSPSPSSARPHPTHGPDEGAAQETQPPQRDPAPAPAPSQPQQPPKRREHPLQLPRPSSLFQADY
jgi:hypothetical protein